MFYGRVIGSIVCTRKDEQLDGLKLMVIQKVDYDNEDEGNAIIAIDTVQAGIGDFVFLAKGKESSLPFGDITHPIEASIVGIIDRTFVDKEVKKC